jgi:pimeloyl-ACP methyl ester carboxylesterase
MADYSDYWYDSSDGLTLYARDYPHSQPLATILCIPGLTRNSADFAPLCKQLNQHYRVLAVDLRGRGKSQHDPEPNNYHPGVYTDDVITLLDSLQLEKVILIGTSLGGLVSMMLTALQTQRVTAAIINDIGPEADPRGLERIVAYVSNPTTVNSWPEAIAKTRNYLGREYPDFSDSDWQDFSRNIYRENGHGQPALDYDPNIAVPLQQNSHNAIPPNLWPLFGALQALPVLLIRGELSEVLSPQCVEKMQTIHPAMQFVEVKQRGHAPLLTEPQCSTAISQFLAALPCAVSV